MSAFGLLAVTLLQGPVSLAPSKGWNIDYAKTNCTLSRTFGTDEQRIVLGFVAMPGKQSMDVVILQPGAAGPSSRLVKAKIAVGLAEPVEYSEVPSVALKEGGRATRLYLGRNRVESLRDAPTLQLTLDGRSFDLQLSSMPAALKALATCEDDLLKDWGIDANILSQIATPARPKNSPIYWVSDNDYPKAALIAGAKGTVLFRLIIDAAGKTQDCAILESSGHKDLDDVACENLVRRSLFHPARDATGRGLPSFYVNRFTWKIPE